MNFYLKIFLWFIGILIILVLGLICFGVYQNKSNKILHATNMLTKDETLMSDSIYSYLNTHMRNNAFVSIGIIDQDSIEYLGVKRENDQFKNIDLRDSVFQIGSISKVFTTSILAQLVVDGDITLDKSIDKYLGFPLHKDLKITFQSLANHTSGLDRMPKGTFKNMVFNPDNPYFSFTDIWMENYLKSEIEIDSDKVGKSEYSNLGMSILGYTLAKVKNTSFEKLCQEYILSKYGMTNSFINNESNNYKIIRAYESSQIIAPIWNLNVFEPAGGIAANIQDMAKFAIQQMKPDNHAFALAHQATVDVNEDMSCGLGWMIIHKAGENELLWHNGATGTVGGYTSSMVIDKKRRKAVIILSTIHHQDAKSILDKLAKVLLKR
jgi:CubicO group peptidase (beta-lactamase class C family)